MPTDYQQSTGVGTFLSVISSTPQMNFKPCGLDSPCRKGFYCYGGDFVCMPCSTLCVGFSREFCEEHCKGIQFETLTPMKQNPNTGSQIGLTTVVSSTASLLVVKSASAVEQNTRAAAQTTITIVKEPVPYGTIIAALLALIFVLVLGTAFYKLYNMLKRTSNYGHVENVEPANGCGKKVCQLSTPAGSYDVESGASLSSSQEVPCNCGITIGNSVKSKARHVSTSTGDLEPDVASASAALLPDKEKSNITIHLP